MNEFTEACLPHIKFQFSIDHPTFEECYAYGYECARSGIDESENPFPEDSQESDQWMEGWWAGFYGEQPVFPIEESDVFVHHCELKADNDSHYADLKESYLTKVLEIAGVIAVSAILGYQVIDMVA